MAKATTGKDPTKNMYSLLTEAMEDLEENPKSKSKKNAPTDAVSAASGGANEAKPAGYIPTPAERQKKEEEKKIQVEKEKKEKQKKAEAEAAAAAAKPKPEKMSREQWDLQNKKNKLAQLNAASNPAPQGGQDNKTNAGFQPARPPKQQHQQQQPLTNSSQPGQPQQGENRGGRRGGGRGRGAGGRNANADAGAEGGQNQAAGRGGAGEGGRRGGRGGEGRRGGRGRRGGGRAGANLDDAQKFEENKNRDVNQRGEDLTNPQPPRKRQYDRKSGGHVTNYGNKNVGNFTIEEQNPDWTNTAAPKENEKGDPAEGWGEDNPAEQPQATFEDVDAATTEAAPAPAPEKGDDKSKEDDPPTKGLEEYLAEQKKRVEELATILAQRNKEKEKEKSSKDDKPEKQRTTFDESGGRYVEVNRLQNQAPTKKPKTEKPAEAEPKAKKPAPPAEPEIKKPSLPNIVFGNTVKKQSGRRYGKEDYVVFEEKEKLAKKMFTKKDKTDKDSAPKEGEQQQTGEENAPVKEKK